MKKSSVLLFAVLSFIPFLNAQNAGDQIFNGIQIHTINIQFYYPNYWDSLTYYYNLGTEICIPARVIINGATPLDSVGVRFKGNSSYSHPNNKKSLRLSFDEFNDDLRWDGLKGVHLNNQYGDPTFMREKIFLDFCRDAGIPAPRAAYANVYLNDTLFAFYSVIEHVNKDFLNSRFGNKNGNLFKAVDAFEGVQAASNFGWNTAVADSYYTRYELKTDGSTTAWPQLINLLDTLNNGSGSYESITGVINTNTLFRAIATDILFSNLDSYSNSGRNFYFYFNTATARMDWIIWDVGLSFGGYSGGVSGYENMSITHLISSTQRPLMAKMYQNPTLKSEYLAALCNLYKNYFSIDRLGAKIDSVASIIRPFVYGDARKQFTNNQFEMNIFSDLNLPNVGGGSRIPGLKSFISQRQTSVNSQLNNLGVFCILPATPGELVINEFAADNDSLTDPAGETDDWVELYNNTSRQIDISGIYLSDNYSLPAKWQFPAGTVIEPNGYLIVWADEDSGQVGLHADFKLSASGERLILSNLDLSVLDSVTFGAQITNMVMARIPNGTGPFVLQLPTLGFNNEGSSGLQNEVETPKDFRVGQNYPNPFNPATKINFVLPQSGRTTITLYDITGAKVAGLFDAELASGSHSLLIDGSDLTSGVYILRIVQGSNSGVIKMTLLK